MLGSVLAVMIFWALYIAAIVVTALDIERSISWMP
jgi:hypothetical protein